MYTFRGLKNIFVASLINQVYLISIKISINTHFTESAFNNEMRHPLRTTPHVMIRALTQFPINNLEAVCRAAEGPHADSDHLLPTSEPKVLCGLRAI